MKVQDLLAIIGGLMKTLLVIGRFLVKPISKLSLNTELVNELFVFEEQTNRSMRKSILQTSSLISNNIEQGPTEKPNAQIAKDFNLIKQENNFYTYDKNNEQPTPLSHMQIRNQQQIRGSILKVKTPNNQFQEPNLIQRRAIAPKKVELHQVEYNSTLPIKNNQSLFQQESVETKKFIKDVNLQRSESDEKKTIKQNESIQYYQIKSNNGQQMRNNFEHQTPTQINAQNNNLKFKKTELSTSNNQSSVNSPSPRSEKSQAISQFQIKSPIKKDQNNMTLEKKDIINLISINQQRNENNFSDKFETIYNITEFPNQKCKSDPQIQDPVQNVFFAENLKQEDQALNIDKITLKGNKFPSESHQNHIGLSPHYQFDIQQKLKKSQSHQPPRYYTDRPSHLQIQRLKDENKDFLEAIKTMPRQTFGKQGAKLITNFLQQNYEVHRGKRKATRKEQTEANAMFSNVLDQVQEKPLHFTFFDYIKYYFAKLKCISKKKQIKYSVKKVTERLDIVYILQKLVEIDKLKVLLLSYEQQKLFEYMPRPVVQSDPEMQEIQWNRNKIDLLKTWTLLNSENGNLDKFTEAFHAYKQIFTKVEKEPLDERLIQMLDPDVKNYFDRTQVDTSQITTPHRISQNNTLLKKQFLPRASIFKQMQAPPSETSQSSPQDSKSMIENSQQISKVRRSSSYIDQTANQVDNSSKLLISPHLLNKDQDLIDKQGNNNKTNELKNHLLNLRLNVEKSDISPAASTKSQKIKNNKQNDNQLFVKNQQIKHQKSNELIEITGDCEEGQISYPRTSIYVNNVEFINQMKENSNQELNSNSRYGQMNIENQFSFTRKSNDSPYFVFDLQKKGSENRSTVSGRFHAPSKYSNMQQSMGMEQSKEVGQPESFDYYNNSYNSPDRISSGHKFSSHKQSQFVKQRSQSQQDLENTSSCNLEDNSIHDQIYFYTQSQNKNYSFGHQNFQDNMNQNNPRIREQSLVLRQAAVLTSSCKIDEDSNAKNQRNRQVNSFAPKQPSLFQNKQNSSQEGTDEQSDKQQNNQQEIEQSPRLLSHRAFKQNSNQIQLQQSKHRKNTSSLGSLNNVSIRINDGQKINSSEQQQNNPAINIDKSSPESKLVINNILSNTTSAFNSKEENNKQLLNPNKLNESLQNQVNRKMTSCSSFQTIPEENIQSRQEEIKFNEINPNKFEDENEFKLINNFLQAENLPEQNTPLNAHKSQNNQVLQPSNYLQSPPLNELISPRESLYFQQPNQNGQPEQQIDPQLPQSISFNDSPQHQMLLFKSCGIGNQMFFKENTPRNNEQSEYIEYRPTRKAEIQDSNIDNNHFIFQNQNAIISKPEGFQYNQDNQIQLANKQQKQQFYFNQFQSPQQMLHINNYNTSNNQDNQLKQPQTYRYSSINFNIPYQNDQNQLQNEQDLTIQNKNTIFNQQATKQRTSLNLQLNLGSNFLQSGAQSPQVQSYLKQNKNAKLYESPYTRQQKFLKKKQQEKQQNQQKLESPQINNYQNPSTPTKSIRNKDLNQDMFNFEQKRIQDNMSNNYSQDKQFNKGKQTPSQTNKQKNTSETKDKLLSKNSFNEDLILTTETDEQIVFINKNQQTNPKEMITDTNFPSNELLNVQSNISLPFNQTKRDSIHETLMTSNSQRNNTILLSNPQQTNESSPIHLLKVSEVDHFQTLNSESDAIIENNNQIKNDNTLKEAEDKNLKTQESNNESIIFFDDKNSEY